jgi:hypothetical protein
MTDRRSFLKILGLGSAAAVTGATVPAPAVPEFSDLSTVGINYLGEQAVLRRGYRSLTVEEMAALSDEEWYALMPQLQAIQCLEVNMMRDRRHG